MIPSSFSPQMDACFQISANKVTVSHRLTHLLQPQNKFQQNAFIKRPKRVCCSSNNDALHVSAKLSKPVFLHKSVVPFAASIVILLSSNPAKAGFLSGFPGIESVPGPELPSVEFLNRFNEENQKKYAEADARFKESPLLKKLLEKSKLNKEKNKQETLDKYCIRGAEWGVGDCSAEGMSPDDREKFIAMLKEKAGVK
ncbi:uncharacterized protein LOC130771192 [Actinidia eriantha]|uniref:uncharacterized protein LOC130771192 n=1 Tax=Actinidia eriantha TaxID=165200 RepID=UPI002586FE43|nr:uncharacterized protein LOC130771192 [Actinidia eriantha]